VLLTASAVAAVAAAATAAAAAGDIAYRMTLSLV
jgi:hypothetical protein